MTDITIQEIEEMLANLRIQWRENPGKREIIKRQARSLEIAKAKIEKRQGAKQMAFAL